MLAYLNNFFFNKLIDINLLSSNSYDYIIINTTYNNLIYSIK